MQGGQTAPENLTLYPATLRNYYHSAYFIGEKYRLDFQNTALVPATFTAPPPPQLFFLKCVCLISRFAVRETPSVAEIVILWGKQWESRCLNVGMSELRVEAIIVPHVAQQGREISKEMAGRQLLSPGCPGQLRGEGAPCSTHGRSQPARPALRTQTHCRGLSPEEAGRRLITSGLFAGTGGETRKTRLTHLLQQGHFSKSKLTQRNNIISPPHLDTHSSRLNFRPNQMIRLIVVCSTFYDLRPKIGPKRAYLVRKGRVLGWPSPISLSGQDRLLIQAARGICYQT